MSTYNQFTKNPKTGKWENALWMDDYYEQYHYGVKFPDGTIVDPWVIQLYVTINEAEAKLLNNEDSISET